LQNNTFSRLFAGQKIIALQRVDSTNTYLKNLLSKSKPLTEGTVIMAEEQFDGRGQSNNKWLSEPGKNLTFSLLLFPSFINPNDQFLLNIAVSIAINDVLTGIIGHECKIKWPNDIFFGNNKLGGVLIENILSGKQWKYAVIGIGINVNQTSFPESIKNITSLKQITNASYSLNNLLEELCAAIETRYGELRVNQYTQHYDRYVSNLYRLNEPHKFITGDSEVIGKITGVNQDGRLLVKVGNETHSYGLKEISYVQEP